MKCLTFDHNKEIWKIWRNVIVENVFPSLNLIIHRKEINNQVNDSKWALTVQPLPPNDIQTKPIHEKLIKDGLISNVKAN